MIIGLGIDLCDIERMRKKCSSPIFAKKIFTDDELNWANRTVAPQNHLAAAFAAREAFAKATGIGIAKAGLRNVSVSHFENGRPFLKLNFDAPSLAPFRDAVFHLSLSHEQNMAAAVVIYERNL